MASADSIRKPEDAPRICFVTNDFVAVIRNGGVGTHFWLMSRLLVKRGWEVHVLFCGEVDDEDIMARMPDRMAEEGIHFTWLDEMPAAVWDGLPSYGDGMNNLDMSQRALEAVEELHAKHRFDIVEFPDWRALGFRCAQAKRSGLAFSDLALAVKLHSTSDWQRRGNSAIRTTPWELKVEWCERYAFERADIQLSPSNYMLGDTRDAGWSIRDDALVAYPFPDPEPNQTAGDGTTDRLAFFGRLERRKGLDIFLDALDELPEDIPALFIGRDTKMEGRWAKQIIEERLGDRPYEIEDQLDREAALARLAGGDSLAVIASRSETFGFTVAECIANEIPFIAADAGGIPEVVRDEEAQRRWLFEPSAEHLALKIKERLAADPADEARLRRQAAERCDPTRWNDEVEAIYRGAVERFRQEAGGKTPDRDRQTVAVAVTHYNHADFLPAALASLAAQTRQPDEVFVIDDGSTEADAVAVFSEQESLYPQWTFLRQENAGPGAGRNRCLELSTSSCFLPFDSDNIARPELIEALVTALEIDPSRDVATCQNLAFVDDTDIAAENFVFRYAPPGGPRLLSPLENLFGDTCGLFRSEALRSVGGFEVDRQSPHEDWETLVKMAFAGFDIDVVPRPLFWYRTSVGGRLETLAADPASNFRLRKRMVEAILADVELSRPERISLWEFLVAFALPNEEVAFLQRAHDEVAEWAHRALDDNSASHEKRFADTVAWYEELLVGASTGALNGVSAKQLWVAAGRRAAGGAVRRAKALSIRGRERVKARRR